MSAAHEPDADDRPAGTLPWALRAYRATDLTVVGNLWYTAWHATYPGDRHPDPLPAWHARLREHAGADWQVTVAEQGDRIIGFSAVNAPRQILTLLYVDPHFQSHGVGSALIEAAKTAHPGGLSLWAQERNMRARRFYERHGFRLAARAHDSRVGQLFVQYRWSPDLAT